MNTNVKSLFEKGAIKNSQQQIDSVSNEIRTYVDAKRGFLIPTITALTPYKDPARNFSELHQVEELLLEAIAHKASDIFIHADQPVTMLKDLDLYSITHRPINQKEADFFLAVVAGGDIATSVLKKNKKINRAFRLYKTIGGVAARYNFRVNASQTTFKGSSETFQLVLRIIATEPPDFNKIGLDEDFLKLTLPHSGMYVIGGVTGSGKSTTLAATFKYILQNFTHIRGNILTHNDPIEYEFDGVQSTHSQVVQSEIPTNFETFADANAEAMRRRPAAVEIGELRLKSSINAAIEIAMTGHPVFATVHATTVAKIIPRLLNRFDHTEQAQAAADIIGSSHTFIAQRLIKNVAGKVFAVREHLILTPENIDEMLDLPDVQKQQNYIRKLMNQSDGSDPRISLTFLKQAERLKANGTIDQANFLKLMG